MAMPHLIVIDDIPEIVRGVIDLAGRYGWSVSGFVRAADALDAFRASPASFDCIVTDIYMPEMDGIELIMAMRKISPLVPIVAVTAGSATYGNRGLTLHMATQLGADAALAKPYSGTELFTIASSLIAENTLSAALAPVV